MEYIYSPKDIRESRGTIMMIADKGYPIVGKSTASYFVKTEVFPNHQITKAWAESNGLYIRDLDVEPIEEEDDVEYNSKEYWERAYWNLKKEYNRLQKDIKNALRIY